MTNMNLTIELESFNMQTGITNKTVTFKKNIKIDNNHHETYRVGVET